MSGRRTTGSRRDEALSGERARQGEIILRTRRRRAIFIAGLVGIVFLPLLLALIW